MQDHDTDIDIELHNPEDAEARRARRMFRLHEVNVLAICAVMAAATLFMIFGKRPTVSEEEKRELTKRPNFTISGYLDGSFTSQFSKFFNDTVPLRSDFKHIIAVFRDHLGIELDDVELHGQLPVIEKTTKPTEPPTEATLAAVTEADTPSATDAASDETETVTETETTAPPTTEAEEEEVDGEMANNILIVKDRGIMLYGGGMSVGEQYAYTLNEYKEKLGKDVNVYSLVAPTTGSYYLPKKYQDYSASETENIDNINSFLEGVIPIDAYGAMLPHKDEAIYSRTDHHWQPLGAYYSAEEFAKVANVPFAPLSDYETIARDDYVGTLYGFSGSAKLKDNPETFTYYAPKNKYTCTYYDTDMTNEREGDLLLDIDNLDPASYYLVFMGGDERVTHVETDVKNKRRLCIIKDSYGNALVPTLTNSFEEIWVVDMRYFTPNIIDFLQENEITDVLFAMNTFSATGGNSEHLQTLLYQ